MLTDIPEGKGPGTWTRVLVDELGSRPARYTAMVNCPSCGKYLYAINHTIDANGQISPSLGHPVQYPPCPWHTYLRLLGWSPVPPVPIRQTFRCAMCPTTTQLLSGWASFMGNSQICPSCLAVYMAKGSP